MERPGAPDVPRARACPVKLIDLHSHWGTKRGYPLQTEEELALQRQTWNSEVRYHTEAEMAQHFRDQGVRAIQIGRASCRERVYVLV